MIKQKSRFCTVIFVKKIPFQAVLASVRMQRAHNTFCNLRPFSMRVTFCKLGRKVRLVARMENERL
jgi:hypothetical protein